MRSERRSDGATERRSLMIGIGTLVLLAAAGCNSPGQALANNAGAVLGPGTPASVRFVRAPDGGVQEVDATGVGSNMHIDYRRQTERDENGVLRETVVLVTDPTKSIDAYLSGTNRQTVTDADNRIRELNNAIAGVKGIAEFFAGLLPGAIGDFRSATGETAQQRDDRLAREAVIDERWNELMRLLREQAAQRGP